VAASLRDAASDRNPRVREVAVQTIASAGNVDTEQVLLAALRDERSNVRQVAALGLPRAAGSRAVAPLAAALIHKDAQTRRSAAQALGAIGSDEATEALNAAAHDKDQPVRDAAIQALGRVGSTGAIRALLALYGGHDRDTSHAAASVLKGLEWKPADARDRATHAVLHGDYEAAVREGGAAVGPLLKAVGDKDASVRREAAKALGGINDASVGAPLVGALADHDEAVRLAALQSLKQLGPLAFTVIVEALDTRATVVRNAAKEVLGGIPHAPGVVGSLIKAFAGRRSGRGDQATVRISGAGAAERARLATESLARILAHAADRIPAAELQAVTALADLELLDDPDDPLRAERVSCETLRARARQEFERRGRSGHQG
jgi:HEAT repeat protein